MQPAEDGSRVDTGSVPAWRAREVPERMAPATAPLPARRPHRENSFADLLAEGVSGEYREFAEAIVRGGQRLMDTLNSVLDLAQIESGQLSARPRPVDHRPAALHRVSRRGVIIAAVAKTATVDVATHANDQ